MLVVCVYLQIALVCRSKATLITLIKAAEVLRVIVIIEVALDASRVLALVAAVPILAVQRLSVPTQG